MRDTPAAADPMRAVRCAQHREIAFGKSERVCIGVDHDGVRRAAAVVRECNEMVFAVANAADAFAGARRIGDMMYAALFGGFMFAGTGSAKASNMLYSARPSADDA